MLDEDHYSCGCGYEVSVLDVLNKKVSLSQRVLPSTKEVICGECGSKHEVATQISVYVCPKCTGNLTEIRVEYEYRTKSASMVAPEIAGCDYSKPLHSDSLALTPENVEEHKRLFPDIEIDSENRPVFTNAKQHEDYLNKIGVHKAIQKTGRSKGKTYSYPGSQCS